MIQSRNPLIQSGSISNIGDICWDLIRSDLSPYQQAEFNIETGVHVCYQIVDNSNRSDVI